MADKKDALLAFIAGAAIGAALGILFAPKSGKETRHELKKLGEDLAGTLGDMKDEAEEKGRKLYSESKEKFLAKKDKISEAFEAGKKAFEKNLK